MEKVPPALAGLIQALVVTLYCVVIALLFSIQPFNQSSQYLAPFTVLLLLVFSAGFTGLAVFGYPIYLVLGHSFKQGLMVAIYTFLYLLAIIVVGLSLVFII